MKITVSQLPKDELEEEKKLREQELQKKTSEEQLKQSIEKKKLQNEKKLREQRLEILKMKQGVSEKIPADIKKEAEKPVVEKPKGIKAVENFFYHNSIYIILVTVFLVIAIILVINLVTKVRPDTNILVLPQDKYIQKLSDFEKFAEKYAKDFNDDGKVKVDTIVIPIEEVKNNPTQGTAHQTKLSAELIAGKTMLIISNEECDVEISAKATLLDLTSIYPGNERVSEYRFYLNSDKAAKLFGVDKMPEGIYIGIRNPEQISGVSQEKAKKQYEEAKLILDGIVKELS